MNKKEASLIKPNSAESICSSAKQLFWQQGIERVSIIDICNAAQISKMTFYRNYKNKQQLAETVIENEMQKVLESFRAIMVGDESFDEKTKALINLYYTASEGLTIDFMRSVGNIQNNAFLQKLEGYRQIMLYELHQEFRLQQQKGAINKLNVNLMTYFVNDLQKKMQDPHLLSIYKNPQELILELTNFFFHGILNNQETILE